MRKALYRSVGLGSLLALGFTLVFQPGAPAQVDGKPVDGKKIEIVKDGNGDLVFSDPDAKINVDQSITWVVTAGGTHDLIGDPPDEAVFKGTGVFKSPATPTQKFGKAGVIKYFCVRHPDTMKGTITVK